MRCLEFGITTEKVLSAKDLRELRKDLYSFGVNRNIDIAMQAENITRRSRRLVVMDMDSTLIQQEVIDELAIHAGVADQVKEITERAMGGQLDFNQSLSMRVGLLKGTPASTFDKVIQNLVYTEGAHYLCKSLKKLGYRLAVISGGFTTVTKHVRNVLGKSPTKAALECAHLTRGDTQVWTTTLRTSCPSMRKETSRELPLDPLSTLT